MKQKIKLLILVMALAVYMLSILIIQTQAEPVGAGVTNVSHLFGTQSPESRTDEGGTINIITVDATQQNYAWKAYVGNISASLTLDDANGQTIYDWTISQSSLSGELYASRASSFSWSGLECVNNTVLATEQTIVNMGASDSDNIDNTFSYTAHPTYVIAGQTIQNSTCKSLFTYVNDTAQTDDESSYFSEILLQNPDGNLIYVANLESDREGYNNNESLNITYDFQMLVPDDDTASTQTTYYFYAEIDS